MQAELSGEHTICVDFCEPAGFSCLRTCFRLQEKSQHLEEIALIIITLENLSPMERFQEFSLMSVGLGSDLHVLLIFEEVMERFATRPAGYNTAAHLSESLRCCR